ncbi:MAG: phenylalanine--tRNA ligase subunit beta [Candidatus Micrarchaeales archaeon]|jgi:phenylalanyl-tRNA synthetase beta chain|uniref:phenylalanine--tRNA ligase n=1 Tax=Candidatus Micrarchaeum acidiphilum ARMAN-2 TaxID=425595 RepID=C7DGH7_MICA2|nr:MAG: phenylalanyl-tRNA synthetase, beta subunit [Candidatus Micrarchaeum acidiphilum ARMAN-2]MCW6161269.1 phenylalanine--tRNA ligase subunit beta [Candidatus Micrarchaeales archaeon]
MAGIDFYKKDIAKHFGAGEFGELVERIGMEVKGSDSDIVSLDITPNRPDLLYFYNFMETLRLFANRGAKSKSYAVESRIRTSIRVTKNVSSIRPNMAALVAEGLDMSGNALKYLVDFTEKLGSTYGRRRKKIAIGLHDYDKIDGGLVYDASHSGKIVPLGESSERTFEEVIRKNRKGMDYAYTITGPSNGKTAYPFLRDSEKTLSLIPIINSNISSISHKTKRMLIDITGIDESVDAVADMLACSLINMGAKVGLAEVSHGSATKTFPMMRRKSIEVGYKAISSVLGRSIAHSELPGLLESMGYSVAKLEKESLMAEVQPYRLDCFSSQDVIEDIAIAYGYDSIGTHSVENAGHGSPDLLEEFKNALGTLLSGFGFLEAYNYYLTNEKTCFEMMGKDFDSRRVVKLKNSKTEAFSILRDSLLPGLLHDISTTGHERMPQRLFEIGHVFSLEQGKPLEATRLGLIIEHSKANASECISIAKSVLGYLGIGYSLAGKDMPSFIPGRCASVVCGGEEIGVLGEIHPSVLNNFRIEEPVVALEMDLDYIMRSIRNTKTKMKN